MCRHYYSEVKEDKLCILHCKNYNFAKFRAKVINILQLQVIELLETDAVPLSLLEGILYQELLYLPTKDLHRFRPKNLKHGFVPVSFSEYLFRKYLIRS